MRARLAPFALSVQGRPLPALAPARTTGPSGDGRRRGGAEHQRAQLYEQGADTAALAELERGGTRSRRTGRSATRSGSSSCSPSIRRGAAVVRGVLGRGGRRGERRAPEGGGGARRGASRCGGHARRPRPRRGGDRARRSARRHRAASPCCSRTWGITGFQASRGGLYSESRVLSVAGRDRLSLELALPEASPAPSAPSPSQLEPAPPPSASPSPPVARDEAPHEVPRVAPPVVDRVGGLGRPRVRLGRDRYRGAQRELEPHAREERGSRVGSESERAVVARGMRSRSGRMR